MRRALHSIPTTLAILAVLCTYGFFACGGTSRFQHPQYRWDSHYTMLADGFLSGHLYVDLEVPPELLALKNPWEPASREGVPLIWDASFFQGKFYLYFSPLPVLLFYIPYRLLTGAYPADSLAAAFFCAWAFLAATAFVRRAILIAGRPFLIPLPLWVLLIGLANVIVYTLAAVQVYHIAAMTGMAMTATWAFSLLKFIELPTTLRAANMSLWLALSFAARPNLIILLAVAAAVVIVMMKRHLLSWKSLLGAIGPMAFIVVAVAWYNYARFGDSLQFGVRYQLTTVDMSKHDICGVCSLPELTRFANHVLHYVFWPPHIRTVFPFIELNVARLDPAVSWPTPGGMTQEIAGIGALVPLTLLGTFVAILFAFSVGRMPLDAGTRSALIVMASGWLILFGLSACWWVVARYTLDFNVLIAAATIVCIEAALARLIPETIRLVPLRIFIAALAIYSIAAGFLLGFVGPGDAFRRLHPEMYNRLADWFR